MPLNLDENGVNFSKNFNIGESFKIETCFVKVKDGQHKF